MTRIKTKSAEYDGKTVDEMRQMLTNLKTKQQSADIFQRKSLQTQIDRLQWIIEQRSR